MLEGQRRWGWRRKWNVKILSSSNGKEKQQSICRVIWQDKAIRKISLQAAGSGLIRSTDTDGGQWADYWNSSGKSYWGIKLRQWNQSVFRTRTQQDLEADEVWLQEEKAGGEDRLWPWWLCGWGRGGAALGNGVGNEESNSSWDVLRFGVVSQPPEALGTCDVVRSPGERFGQARCVPGAQVITAARKSMRSFIERLKSEKKNAMRTQSRGI